MEITERIEQLVAKAKQQRTLSQDATLPLFQRRLALVRCYAAMQTAERHARSLATILSEREAC